MRLKCLFCKYKAVCVPEQESHLTSYKKLQKDYKNLYDDYNDLFVKYENLKFNLQTFIRENDKH